MLSRNELAIAFTILASFLFGVLLNPPVPFTKKDILRGIEHTASSSPASPTTKKHVLMGFNVNLDAVVLRGNEFVADFVGGADVVNAVPEVTSGEIEILTPSDLAHVFAHHFKTSSAGERSIASDALWHSLVKHLHHQQQQQQLSKNIETKLGGNAALMAEAMTSAAGASGGVKVSLLGLAGPKIASLLSEYTNLALVSGSASADDAGAAVDILGQQFETKRDEVHLILEYAAGSKFGKKLTAQRANRFIVSRDFSNAALGGVEQLAAAVGAAGDKVDLVVLAGLHLMDSLLPSHAHKEERIRQVNQAVRSSLSTGTRIHLELASTSDQALTRAIVTQLDYESVGLNEEEFYSVCRSLDVCTDDGGKDSALLSKTHTPNARRVQQVVLALFSKLPKLQRVHYHAFSYHLVAQRAGEETQKRWPNAQQAVAAGSLRATLRACGVTSPAQLHGNQLGLGVASFKLLSADSAAEDGSVVREVSANETVIYSHAGGVDFYFTPVVSCLAPKQTVGLGDNISAHALLKQL